MDKLQSASDRNAAQDNVPHLITHVTTTAAATTDEAVTETIQVELHQANLTPRQHLLDSGYITAPILVSSQHYGIEVIGPARGDVKWQANTEHGIDASQFIIDWERKFTTCPRSVSRARVGRQLLTEKGRVRCNLFGFSNPVERDNGRDMFFQRQRPGTTQRETDSADGITISLRLFQKIVNSCCDILVGFILFKS